jgi:hypothetical protein
MPDRGGGTMRTALFLGVGVLIALAGVVFTLQGFGVLGGSFMSGVTLWAVIGPIIAVVGLIIAAVGLGRDSASM